MSDQIQLQTFTFSLKDKNLDTDSEEVRKIFRSAGLHYDDFVYIDLDDWGLINPDIYERRDPDRTIHVSLWYLYQTLCYGIHKTSRRSPETYISISVQSSPLSKDEALAFSKRFDGTLLEVEAQLPESEATDLPDKLHEWIRPV